jgi:hypothetical protein
MPGSSKVDLQTSNGSDPFGAEVYVQEQTGSTDNLG